MFYYIFRLAMGHLTARDDDDDGDDDDFRQGGYVMPGVRLYVCRVLLSVRLLTTLCKNY